MKKHLLTWCLFSFINMTLFSQSNNTVTPETLWQLPRVSLEDISPDGDLILYAATTYDLATNQSKSALYTVNVAGGNSTRITPEKVRASSARFRPDGKKIGFLNDDKMFEINLDGTGLSQVSDIPMNGFAYDPNLKQVLFVTDVKYFPNTQDIHPDLSLTKGRVIDGLMYRHFKSWDDYKRSNIFLSEYLGGKLVGDTLNIMKGMPFDAPLQPSGGMEQIAWSPNGRYIAYTCRAANGTPLSKSTNSDIFLYDVINNTTRNLSEANLGYDLEPSFSPDSRFLIWNSMERAGFEADKNRIILFNLTNGQKTDLTEGYDFWADHPQFSRDGKSIFFIAQYKGTRQLATVEINTKKIRNITDGYFDYTAFQVSERRLVASRQSMSEPTEIYSIIPQTGAVLQVTQQTESVWGKLKKGEVISKNIRTSDGNNMLVWQILPPNFDASKRYPAILYCQGGPQSMVSQFFSYRWNMQCMAAQGYVVIAPCRRGMPGFGQAWNDTISRNWGNQAMQDLLFAADAAANESFIDKEKMGAVGASFGGFSTFWLAGNHKKRFKCFIAHAGIFNLESFYGTTEEVWFSDWDLGAYWDEKNRKEVYAQQSPHLFVQNWDTPILITHGGRDFRVPESEGMQAFQVAQLRDIPSRFVYFPDEGHHISIPQNSVLWYREFFAWLEKYLKK